VEGIKRKDIIQLMRKTESLNYGEIGIAKDDAKQGKINVFFEGRPATYVCQEQWFRKVDLDALNKEIEE
jgi:hypothetical protein